MSHQVLYRKYRSADLSDVVGQPHIVTALEAALKKERVAHAYLLTGPRGVGKTSIARILARRANGLPATEELSNHLDIIEIDAASNRGIDEIRSLREGVSSASSSLKYKVYIIDEVHMLTREAFNALLKTLEEPPPHVIFILATTEVHKLPDTIVSRTQRFDLRAISEADMVVHLKTIAKAENIAITDEALAMIASMSAGGFRDAIGLLDQISVLEGEITDQTVAEYFGRADRASLEQLLGHVQQGEVEAALSQVQDFSDRGFGLNEICVQLLQLLHTQLHGADSKQQAFIVRATTELHQALQDFKLHAHPSLPLELAIVRIVQPTSVVVAQTIQPSVSKSVPPATQPTQPVEMPIAKQQPALKSATSLLEPTHVDADKLLQKALSMVKHDNNSLYAVLRSAQLNLTGDTLMASFRFSFHRERLEEPRNRQLLEKCLTRTFGRDIMVRTEIVTEKPTAEAPLASAEAANGELVNAAMAIFKGEIIDGQDQN